nr:hypothetical protein [Tanacetum cinerariifolium]
MPTGRHFTLYDSYPLTRILDQMEEPLELSPSVSSSSNVTMLSRLFFGTWTPDAQVNMTGDRSKLCLTVTSDCNLDLTL